MGGMQLSGGSISTGGANTTGGTFVDGGADAGEVGRDTGSGGFISDTGVADTVKSGGVISTGGVVASGGTTGGTNHNGKWVVMPVGDSITGTTCYPQLLSKNLIAAGHTNFELVGSVLNNQACEASHVQTEGHGGWLVTSLLPNGSNANVQTKWFNDAKPDIVILHFATNDLWNNVPPANILTAYSLIVDSARAAVANVIFFVAQIVPLAPSSCSECPARTSTFNAQIPAWATGKAKSNSPIYVVDLASGWVPSVDTGDGVHPNLVGSKKMADKMTQAIIDKKLF
jgi:lysophospholipase L1-like esterase